MRRVAYEITWNHNVLNFFNLQSFTELRVCNSDDFKVEIVLGCNRLKDILSIATPLSRASLGIEMSVGWMIKASGLSRKTPSSCASWLITPSRTSPATWGMSSILSLTKILLQFVRDS